MIAQLSTVPSSGVQRTVARPALALVLLAPAMAELLSSSTPPPVYFIPWVFLVFTILYGGTALLIREWVVRNRRGWPAMLFFGAAAGVLNEGLAARSFFDPKWRSLGPLGRYGRWGGVNWIWAVDVTAFHAVMTAALPVMAVTVIYPQMRDRIWLGPRAIAAVAVLTLLDWMLMFSKGGSWPLTPARWFATFLVACAFALGAVLTRRRRVIESGSLLQTPRPWSAFAALGFISSAVYILLVYFAPLALPPAVTIALGAAGFVCVAVLLSRWTESGGLDRAQRFGLVAGVALFFALLAPVQDFNSSRPVPAHDMSLVGAATLLCIAMLYRRVRTEAQA